MDFLKYSVIILFVLLTIVTIMLRPEMHQPMIIEDADFKLTRISDTISATNIPVTSTVREASKTVEVSRPIETKKDINIKIQNQPDDIVKQVSVTPSDNMPKRTKQVVKDDISQVELLKKIIDEAEKQVSQQQEQPKPAEQPKPIEKPQPVRQPKPVEKQSEHKNPYMTEQEEIIAWNIWRSNIQNQIMKDSNIDYAPLGTMFMFTFVVDKFGNVSNIKVECSNPNFMDVARNNVKPAISRLQRKPILNFPRGTQRTSTVVTGLFLIGTQERYSSPNDFSDYERIVH